VIRAGKKLYQLSSREFRLPIYVNNGQVITEAADDIPLLSWPDGGWCFEGNFYMLDLYYRGLSRINKGGTLLAYATNISHLLRFCFFNKINLIDLSDNQFILFIKLLQGEKLHSKSEISIRDANTVIAIGRNCLDFLNYIGKLNFQPNFIASQGQIRAELKVSVGNSASLSSQSKINKTYWHHRSFPTPDPKVKRLPISTDAIKKLWGIVQSSSKSIFVRKRRYVMLKLLEITGGRRSEIALLKIKDILNASEMTTPFLKIRTLKKRGGIEVYREIPIARHDIAYLIEFVEKNRQRVIRTTCGKSNDEGYLLVNENTGKKIQANTVTQEVSILAKAAGLKEKICPHMFRHRFITKLFVALIEQHNFENLEDFRRALLDKEALKQKVQQWTGHSNLDSLDIYIHLAFDEVTTFKKTYNVVQTMQIIESFKHTLDQIEGELFNGVPPKLVVENLKNLVDALQNDLKVSNEILIISEQSILND